MLFTKYTFIHYTIELRLFSKRLVSKYIHEFLFHGCYMDIFDRKDMFLRKNIKTLITLENELIGKNGKQFQIQ